MINLSPDDAYSLDIAKNWINQGYRDYTSSPQISALEHRLCDEVLDRAEQVVADLALEQVANVCGAWSGAVRNALRAALALYVLSTPVFADTPTNVTLILENEAGMVTQVPDLTGRECDAIASLLAPRKPASGISYDSCLVLGGICKGTYSMPQSKPPTSKLVTWRCSAPTDGGGSK